MNNMLRGKDILKKSLKLQSTCLKNLITVNLDDTVYEIKNIMEYNKLKYIKIYNLYGGKSIIGYDEVKEICQIQDSIYKNKQE